MKNPILDIILDVIKPVLSYICYKLIDNWFETFKGRKKPAKKTRRHKKRRRK
ncbi:hypothetical protein MK370_09060 [Streptococcus sanguinis]|uniref:hypothetical protein n=1 Tax=Streptococcus sanguinis TaxID=1305 RepID=UPI0022832F8A|nr:hypothetical protein [Streptococcus sanguinis]MCY7041677.1 hypothetical protein [Streptococcus sanguinis]